MRYGTSPGTRSGPGRVKPGVNRVQTGPKPCLNRPTPGVRPGGKPDPGRTLSIYRYKLTLSGRLLLWILLLLAALLNITTRALVRLCSP